MGLLVSSDLTWMRFGPSPEQHLMFPIEINSMPEAAIVALEYWN